MIYSDWPKLDCHINELSGTVQQLKMEILKLTYLIGLFISNQKFKS